MAKIISFSSGRKDRGAKEEPSDEAVPFEKLLRESLNLDPSSEEDLLPLLNRLSEGAASAPCGSEFETSLAKEWASVFRDYMALSFLKYEKEQVGQDALEKGFRQAVLAKFRAFAESPLDMVASEACEKIFGILCVSVHAPFDIGYANLSFVESLERERGLEAGGSCQAFMVRLMDVALEHLEKTRDPKAINRTLSVLAHAKQLPWLENKLAERWERLAKAEWDEGNQAIGLSRLEGVLDCSAFSERFRKRARQFYNRLQAANEGGVVQLLPPPKDPWRGPLSRKGKNATLLKLGE